MSGQTSQHRRYLGITTQRALTGGTRTCIQTPGVEYTPEDLQPDNVKQILNNASLVYFDGRLTASAILLAKAARQRGVPVLVEAERLREGLDELLKEADYLCTSAHFPKVMCCCLTCVHVRCDAGHHAAIPLPLPLFLSKATSVSRHNSLPTTSNQDQAHASPT